MELFLSQNRGLSKVSPWIKKGARISAMIYSIKKTIQCNPRDLDLNKKAQVCFMFLDTIIMVIYMCRARVRQLSLRTESLLTKVLSWSEPSWQLSTLAPSPSESGRKKRR